MPEQELDHESRRDHAGWFMRGFATAALLFAAVLYLTGYFATADTKDAPASNQIIVGK